MKFFMGKKSGRDWVAENFADTSKPSLDNALVMGDNVTYSGAVGTTGSTLPVDYGTPGTVGATTLTKEPFYDIDEIANSTDTSKYSPNLIRMAQGLRDMRVAYSLHASEFAKTLFSAQDELKLTEADVEKAIGYIIKQRKVVNESAVGAIQILAKNSKTT